MRGERIRQVVEVLMCGARVLQQILQEQHVTRDTLHWQDEERFD